MRATFFFSVMLALSLSARGQSFTNPQNTWNVEEFISFGAHYTFIYHYDGDSTVGTKNYQKMYYWWDSLYSSREFVGLIREEGARVYYIHPQMQNEGLLYDFNVMPGDTLEVISLFCPEPSELEFVCQTLDSVMIKTGEYRKRWTFGSPYILDIWVEGIGSMHGAVHSSLYTCMIDYYAFLLCFYVDGALVFQPAGYSTCYINTVGIGENAKEKNPILYPNPVKSGDLIRLISPSDYNSLEIFSSQGILKMHLTNVGFANKPIETTGFATGVYFIRLSNRNGETVVGRLIVL